MQLSIVLPTYNERKNIEVLIPKLEEFVSTLYEDFEIIVVDDSSPDGTAKIVKKLQKKYSNLRLIIREKKEGIGAALKEGYNAALGDVIFSMDADLAFDFNDIKKLLLKFNEGFDLVFGTKYLKTSTYEKKGFYAKMKAFISFSANILIQKMLCLSFTDFFLNFRVFKKNLWNSISIKANENNFLFEMIIEANIKGFKLAEVPIKFKAERIYGKSKFSLLKQGIRVFFSLIKYFFVKLRS